MYWQILTYPGTPINTTGISGHTYQHHWHIRAHLLTPLAYLDTPINTTGIYQHLSQHTASLVSTILFSQFPASLQSRELNAGLKGNRFSGFNQSILDLWNLQQDVLNNILKWKADDCSLHMNLAAIWASKDL